MNAQEAKAAVDAANAKLEKVIAEIKVLKAAVAAGGPLPQDVVDSISRLGVLVGQADDLNEDAPTGDVPANP